MNANAVNAVKSDRSS